MLSVEKITLTCVDFGPLRAYAVTQFFRPVFCLRIEALSKPGLISSCMWSVYIEEYIEESVRYCSLYHIIFLFFLSIGK